MMWRGESEIHELSEGDETVEVIIKVMHLFALSKKHLARFYYQNHKDVMG